MLISASAVGSNGSSNHILTEGSVGESFNTKGQRGNLAVNLCQAWEEFVLQAKDHGVRVCILRLGVVLGKVSGIVQEIHPNLSWAWEGDFWRWQPNDAMGAYRWWRQRRIFLLDNNHSVTLNLTAPNTNEDGRGPITNYAFSTCTADMLGRPYSSRSQFLFWKSCLGKTLTAFYWQARM